jgi:signal transduction histidine kinase
MKVVVVDDSPDVRAALRDLLRRHDEFELVGEGADVDDARALVERHRPDIVLLDVTMPGGSGADATAAVRAADPDVRVVALSSFPDANRVASMLAAGASGYVLKNAPEDQMLAALTAAVAGRPAVGAEAVHDVLSDLTELYRGQRARAEGLAEVDRMKRTFLSLVGDQLRTPLTAITGSLTTLQRGWDRLDDATKREFIDTVTVQAARMARRVEQISTVANLARESAPRARSTFALDGVAREVWVQHEHRFAGRSVRHLLRPVVVTGDRNAALTVASTLLENAADHTTGPVVVSVDVRDGAGILAVRDEGPGLDAADVSRLAAEPFEPGDASDTREVGGLGLSLYLARRLLEMDGGALQIDSVPGHGSTFTAVLPASG